MVIKKKDTNKPLVIDLSGKEGNAYALLGYAKTFCNQLDYDFDSIQKEMTSSDYEHLVQTFDKHFGDYVILEQ
tara:strand:- start:51 stop:269 length:219 start_codon:yes stop_codon:yes gene_type:complete